MPDSPLPNSHLTFTSLAEFSAWAKYRLEEMEAGLAAMEEEMRGLSAAARQRAADAMAKARGWHDTFVAGVRAAGMRAVADTEDAAFKAATEVLKEAWVQFEIEMENWAISGEQKSAAFDARGRALLAAWHGAVAGYRAQALIAANGARKNLLGVAAELEAEAERCARRFEQLSHAGALAWLAMGEALKDSRQAFERASAQARAAVADALKKAAN